MTKPIDLDRILELAKKLRSDPLSISAASNLKNACDPTTITAMAEELKEARKLLGFYSNKKKVNQMINGTGDDFEEVDGIFHGGKRARKHMKKWGLE